MDHYSGANEYNCMNQLKSSLLSFKTTGIDINWLKIYAWLWRKNLIYIYSDFTWMQQRVAAPALGMV